MDILEWCEVNNKKNCKAFDMNGRDIVQGKHVKNKKEIDVPSLVYKMIEVICRIGVERKE